MSDIGEDPIDKDVECEFHGGIGGGGRGNSAEICGAGEGFPTGFFVEDFFGAGNVEGGGGVGGELADVGGVVEDETRGGGC